MKASKHHKPKRNLPLPAFLLIPLALSSFALSPTVRAQTFYYVSTATGIDKVSSTGVVNPFATLSGAPQGLAVDSSGNLYVDFYNNSQISEITPGGMVGL